MDTETMLTTFDNPYDPFDNFDQWFMFDIEKGYYTCNYLARISNWREGLSTIEENLDRERAIDAIIDHDFLNIYKKVTRNVKHEENEVPST